MKNIDKDGTVLNVSGGTGMGMDADHYKNILIAPMAYGQSLTILALAEALLFAAGDGGGCRLAVVRCCKPVRLRHALPGERRVE